MSVQKLRLSIDIAVIKDLYSKGKSLSAIADSLDVSPKSIRLRLLKENIKVRNISESLKVSDSYNISSKNKKNIKLGIKD
jgi:predicted DNA-binding protein YlxM (UPF0122 family)